jgi:hypothetical protein
MLHFDQGGELKRTFLITALQRNKNPQLRLRALQEIAAAKDAEAFDDAVEYIGTWPRDDRREGVKIVLQALAERKIGRRDQANNWIWRCAEYTRELHEEYAVQRWPETKRLLGLLVNSSGGAHARNARRLVHAARQQDRRLAAALLAAALAHTAEAGEVLNGARMRMSRKPAALARELLRNFPKGKGKRTRRRKRKGAAGENGQLEAGMLAEGAVLDDDETIVDVDLDLDSDIDLDDDDADEAVEEKPKPRSRSRRRTKDADPGDAAPEPAGEEEGGAKAAEEKPKPARKPRASKAPAKKPPKPPEPGETPKPAPKPRASRRSAPKPPAVPDVTADAAEAVRRAVSGESEAA